MPRRVVRRCPGLHWRSCETFDSLVNSRRMLGWVVRTYFTLFAGRAAGLLTADGLSIVEKLLVADPPFAVGSAYSAWYQAVRCFARLY